MKATKLIPNLTYNILTFNHPTKECTFYFTNKEDENITRIYKPLVPPEVIDEFGEQDYYYTSFSLQTEGFFAITKRSKPIYTQTTNEEDENKWVAVKNSAFTKSLLRRYYNANIHAFFQQNGHLIKPNFIDDIEIWLPLFTEDSHYKFFEKYTIKVQIAKVTNQPELLITYAGKSKVFRQSITDFMSQVSPECFNWVTYKGKLYKYDETSDTIKKDLENVFPVWNFKLRDALHQSTPAPKKENRYINFKKHIDDFYNKHLNIKEFKAIIPINCDSFIKIADRKIGKVKDESNILLFADKTQNVVPFNGMKKGPFRTPEYSKIQFFFILHQDDKDVAKLMNGFFDKGIFSFHGLYDFAKVPYFTKPHFSIIFSNKENPLPEIEHEIIARDFNTETHYIAIYLSPHSKNTVSKEQKSIYYKVKELLLKRGITSQAIESEKIRTEVRNNSRYDYSLTNIAIAILAKLDGIPWQLKTKLKNELIVGVGAFKNKDTDIQYIGSAFSFANDGKFKRFECFQKNQTEELAGSIIRQIKDYVSVNSNINRLIIHFYKNMKDTELDPIQKGLENLGLEIPVFIITINKTVSHDIVAFDNNWNDLMPQSGTFINIGYNRFLLFNNTRYHNASFNPNDGYPFPIKLSIRCSKEEQAKDSKTIKELIDQIYQFSRMYWKSVRQQNLPVTIKYPEMVAEIFPYFSGNEIPEFGKDNLWFL